MIKRFKQQFRRLALLLNAVIAPACLKIVLLMTLAFGSPLAFAAPGEIIINNAGLVYDGGTREAEVPFTQFSEIEFLQYVTNPEYPSADSYFLGASTCVGSGGLFSLPAPKSFGGDEIVTGSEVLLAPAQNFRSGEAIFVRVHDVSANMDPLVQESVSILISTEATPEEEEVLIMETGADTGIFIGYIQTSTSATQANNCEFSVESNLAISARYIDSLNADDVVTTAALVDPFGVVFDAETGEVIEDAHVQLLNEDGTPAEVFGDVIEPYPNEMDVGETIVTSARTYFHDAGSYRFPLINPDQTYRLEVTAPGYFMYGHELTQSEIDDINAVGSFSLIAGSGGENFFVPNGPPLRIDIPMLSNDSSLYVTKTVSKQTASIGDFVKYAISVSNRHEILDVSDVVVNDYLPKGFRYQQGSLRLNNVKVSDPNIAEDGRTLSLNGGDILMGETSILTYVAEITAGSEMGEAINTASATANSGVTTSNVASAKVFVKEELFRSRSFLTGRVHGGACGTTRGDVGVPGVKIYMEDGSFVVSDKDGRWHMDNIKPGTHVLQIDELSLPEGTEVVNCYDNTRRAGNNLSRFVNVQGGTVWREDFVLRTKESTYVHVTQSLTSEVVGRDVEYILRIDPNGLDIANFTANIELPNDGLAYLVGSSSFNHDPIADPNIIGDTLNFELVNLSNAWNSYLRFSLRASRNAIIGDYPVTARVSFVDGNGKLIELPVSINVIRLDRLSSWGRDVYSTFATFDLESANDPTLQSIANSKRIEEGLTDNNKLNSDGLDKRQLGSRLFTDHDRLVLGRANNVAALVQASAELDPSLMQIARVARTPINKKYKKREKKADVLREQPLAEEKPEVADESPPEEQVVEKLPDSSPEPQVEPSVVVAEVEPKTKTTVKQEAPSIETPEASEPIQILEPSRYYGGLIEYSLPTNDSGEQLAKVETNSLESLSRAEKLKPGFVGIKEGHKFSNRYIVVSAYHKFGLEASLYVDGKEVSKEQIAVAVKGSRKELGYASYIGVDLGEPGEHVVEFKGIGPFGNVRQHEKVNVTLTGKVERIELVGFDENVADGRTPVKLKLAMFDDEDRLIQASVPLKVYVNGLSLRKNEVEDPLQKQTNQIVTSGSGEIYFDPVTRSGLYTIQFENEDSGYITEDLNFYIKPEYRDWIMVGFAEGTYAHNALSGNAENLSAIEAEESYTDGKVAFYAKGKVKGEWLATVAYDSSKETDRKVHDMVQANQYFTLYGDNSARHHDASSAEKLYVKIEKGLFYALFGDYETNLDTTELSRYERSLTGFKSEYIGENLQTTMFAADSRYAHRRDEIRGEGTSGLYHLSANQIVINSEEIIIETRDRFRSEEIIEQVPLTRHTDYNIDYDDGTLWFKTPISAQDEAFNPIYIVANFETENGEQSVQGGARWQLNTTDRKITVGATTIHEGLDGERSNLGGADVTWKPDNKNTVKVEGARTDVDTAARVEQTDNAFLVAHEYADKRLAVRTYAREQAGEFGLGQQNASEGGTQKAGTEAAYKINEKVSVNGKVTKEANLATETDRITGEARVNVREEKYGYYAGMKTAHDDFVFQDDTESTLLTAGADTRLYHSRLQLQGAVEKGVGDTDNADYPDRLRLGTEFKLSNIASLFAEQEFAWGDGVDSQNTRAGIKGTPWRGATVQTSVEQENNAEAERVFANAGLNQEWRISQSLSADFGLDRVQTFRDKVVTPFNENVPATNGVSTDYTAVSAGLGYKQFDWSANTKVEYRIADDSTKWNMQNGVSHKLDQDSSLLATWRMLDINTVTGNKSFNSNLGLGYVFRPLSGKWTIFERMNYILDRETTIVSGLSPVTSYGKKVVNNLNTNYRANSRNQLSLQYGSKYVYDTIDDEDYGGYTDLIGIEYRYDIREDWDIGVRTSLLHSWNAEVWDKSYGLSGGWSPMKNLWLNLGYNFEGFSDSDFSGSNYSAKGFYLSFRIKFDQNSLKDVKNYREQRQLKKASEIADEETSSDETYHLNNGEVVNE